MRTINYIWPIIPTIHALVLANSQLLPNNPLFNLLDKYIRTALYGCSTSCRLNKPCLLPSMPTLNLPTALTLVLIDKSSTIFLGSVLLSSLLCNYYWGHCLFPWKPAEINATWTIQGGAPTLFCCLRIENLFKTVSKFDFIHCACYMYVCFMLN